MPDFGSVVDGRVQSILLLADKMSQAPSTSWRWKIFDVSLYSRKERVQACVKFLQVSPKKIMSLSLET